jgi:hypothetical protein
MRDDLHDDAAVVPPNFDSYPLNEEDADVDWWREVLLQDLDVLMLFDPSLDGVEDSDVSRELRLINLHPTQWFLPFPSSA